MRGDVCDINRELAVSLEYPVVLHQYVGPDPAMRTAFVGQEVACVDQHGRYLAKPFAEQF